MAVEGEGMSVHFFCCLWSARHWAGEADTQPSLAFLGVSLVWTRDMNPVVTSVNAQLCCVDGCAGKGHLATRTYHRVSGFGVPEPGCEGRKGLLGEERGRCFQAVGTAWAEAL